MKVLGGHKAHDLVLSVWTKLVTMRRTVSGGLSCRLVPVDVRWSAEGKAQAIAETQAPDASAGFGAMSISIARSWNRFFEPVGDFNAGRRSLTRGRHRQSDFRAACCFLN
jgi:hypothetical protein